MDFEYNEYYGKLVLNPTDCILRFEHKGTCRIYEQTYFDRDFTELSALGGIEFVGHLLQLCFIKKEASVRALTFAATSSKLTMDIQHTSSVLLRAIGVTIVVPAIKKQSGVSDVDAINRKIKEITDTLTSALEVRIKALEERCGDSIIVPGCIYAIPVTVPSFAFVRNQTALPSGDIYAYVNPGMTTRGVSYSGGTHSDINWSNPFNNTNGCSTSWTQGTPQTLGYAHSGITSLKNLVYLTKCTQLTLSGISEITDFSPLGKMTWLQSLSIVASCIPNNSTDFKKTYYPPLRDISWIRSLKNLTSVSFYGCNQLTDITPLSDLPNLTSLDIRGTNVQNHAFLTNGSLKITK